MVLMSVVIALLGREQDDHEFTISLSLHSSSLGNKIEGTNKRKLKGI
jgi:hypothetical protein